MKTTFLKLILFLILGIISVNLRAGDTTDIVWQKNIFPSRCGDVKFSPDGKYIYAAINYNIVKLDALTGDSLSTFEGKHKGLEEFKMDISALGNYIVTKDQLIAGMLWDCKNERLLQNLSDTLKSACTCIAIDPFERYIIFGGGDLFSVIDIKTLQTITTFRCTGVSMSSSVAVKFSHDGTKFAIVSWYEEEWTKDTKTLVTLWETGTWKQIKKIIFRDTRTDLTELKFSFNDSLLSVMYESRIVYLSDLNTNKTIEFNKDITEKLIFCNDLVFLPDNNHCMLSYFNLMGESSLNLINLLTLNTEKQYNINVLNSDCSQRTKAVIVNGIDRLTCLIPTITNIVESKINNERIKISELNNALLLELSTTYFGRASAEIIDIQGNSLYSKDLGYLNLGNNKVELNVNLPRGVYFIKLQIDGKTISQKFQIIK